MQVITNQNFYTVFIFHHNKQLTLNRTEIDISKDVSLSIHLLLQISFLSFLTLYGMAILGIFFMKCWGEKQSILNYMQCLVGRGGGVSKQFHADLEKFSIWGWRGSRDILYFPFFDNLTIYQHI